jgi:hypothetical protein
VLIVQVDGVDAEPLQRRVAGAPDVRGRSVDTDEGSVRGAHVAELRRDDDLIAPVFDRRADEPFVRGRAVRVGGVQEVDAEIEGAVNRRDRFGVVPAGVEIGHPHAAESDRGHALRGPAERAVLPLHAISSSRVDADADQVCTPGASCPVRATYSRYDPG